MDGRVHDLRTIADGTTIQARVVDIAADFPLRLVEASGDISFELTERSGIDWFDLDLGVMLDGQRISLVPALLDFIANTGWTPWRASGRKPTITPCRCCCRSPMAGC